MNQKSLILIICIGIVLGVSLSFYAYNSFQPTTIPTKNIGNTQEAPTQQWLTYYREDAFSLRYPETWAVNPALNGIPPQENEWRFVDGAKNDAVGAIPAFVFTVRRLENEQGLDCSEWIEQEKDHEIQGLVDNGSFTRVEAEEFFETRYSPLASESFRYVQACRRPDGLGEDTLRRYYVANERHMYEVSFPKPGLTDEQAYHAEQNSVYAKEMMDTILLYPQLPSDTKKLLSSHIEDFSLYRLAQDKTVGTGNCPNMNAEFQELLLAANTGERKELLLNNGLSLITTPNYLGWTNERFFGFNQDDTALCAAGGVYPLRAYADRLLWRGVCSTGKMPDENSPDFMTFDACLVADETLSEFSF